MIINLRGGELREHSHAQGHVGVVLEGEFSFTCGAEEVVLRAGDLSRVPAGQPHGVRCSERAVITQIREPSGSQAGCSCCS